MTEAELRAMSIETLDDWIQQRGAIARAARAELDQAKADMALGWKVLNARMAKPVRPAVSA
jgi:hypothetical protein